ncbi:MAG: hypothetical protein QGH51_10000 [Planctomycetota bacterium]|jgi:hypothetical protein|nr:hypothetical protein [Planctomycetota bacterium]
MSPFFGHAILLVVFSFVLGAVVSGYRHDNKSEVLRGTLRRSLQFFGAVVLLGTISYFMSLWLS